MYMDDRTIRLQLWDTAGQERFRTLIPSYIRDSAVVIIVYDVTSRSSFEAVEHWISEVHRERGEDVIVALIGNKNDLTDQRQVESDEGEAKARRLSATVFLETSAKSGANVRNLFTEIAGALNKLEPTDASSMKANLIDVKLQAGGNGSSSAFKSATKNCSC
jgi:Ras-related protein Rab-6A